ncbi:MAG: helix-turn-helix transcriptional regulator [Oscillospiraceae bacterium]|nr:helix-turn-helix transcriptional regulator [Oscillospiraceae bacterium]
MTLGERLKEYRQTEGLSQEQLAEALNVSRQAITKWENDKGLPDIDNLIAISKMVRVTLDDIVKGETEIVKKVSEKRAINTKLSLVTAVVFFIVSIIWIIVGCVNLNSTYWALPVMNFICAAVLLVCAFIHVKRYLSFKE